MTDNKLLTQEQASSLIRQVQPLLRSNGAKSDLRLGQAIMVFLANYEDNRYLYNKIVEEDDFFYEVDDEIAIEKFYKICVDSGDATTPLSTPWYSKS